MFELARREAKVKYGDMLNIRGAIFASVVASISLIILYSQTKRLDLINILVSFAVTVLASYLFYWYGLGWILLKRMFWIGYLRLSIAYRNGIVQYDGNDYICISIDS